MPFLYLLWQYKFIVEDKMALPVDPAFWDYLMSSSQLAWGLMVYEQDWLDKQFPDTKALLVSEAACYCMCL